MQVRTVLMPIGCGILACTMYSIPSIASDQVCYTYDELARIQIADYDNNAKIEYQLDAHGNRLSLERSATGSGNCPMPTGIEGEGDLEDGTTNGWIRNLDPVAGDFNVPGYIPVSEITTIPILPHVTDPEGNPMTVIAAHTANRGGSVSISTDGTVLEYTSHAGLQCNHAQDVITYTISDGRGGTATAEINVSYAFAELNFQTFAPSAADDGPQYLVFESASQTFTIDYLSNDGTIGTGDTTAQLSIVGYTSPLPGNTIIVEGTTISLDPNANLGWNGMRTVTYDYTITASYTNCQTGEVETHPGSSTATVTLIAERNPG